MVMSLRDFPARAFSTSRSKDPCAPRWSSLVVSSLARGSPSPAHTADVMVLHAGEDHAGIVQMCVRAYPATPAKQHHDRTYIFHCVMAEAASNTSIALLTDIRGSRLAFFVLSRRGTEYQN